MATKKTDWRIVIGQRGWVWAGAYRRVGDYIRLENSFCIRKWGTTKGLGELALGGPTPRTVLEPSGTVEIHAMAVIASIKCETPGRWKR